MNWKQSLDRYLSEPPDDGFDGWAESVAEAHSEQFYNDNEKWMDAYDGKYNDWLQELYYNRGASPLQSAEIIERAYRLFINNGGM